MFFFEDLIKPDKKPAILQILPGYAKKFRLTLLDNACKSLKKLYLDSSLNMIFKDLQKSNGIYDSVSISQEEALNIGSHTRNLSKSNKWHEHSASRTTTSDTKETCRTKLDMASLSLINKI